MRLSSIPFVRHTACLLPLLPVLAAAVGLAPGCAASRDSVKEESHLIVVEGIVSVRGNEPFARLMLVTDERNSYLLMPEDQAERSVIQKEAPGRFRVSGIPYKSDWQGREFTHLRVRQWERLDS